VLIHRKWINIKKYHKNGAPHFLNVSISEIVPSSFSISFVLKNQCKSHNERLDYYRVPPFFLSKISFCGKNLHIAIGQESSMLIFFWQGYIFAIALHLASVSVYFLSPKKDGILYGALMGHVLDLN
jgi:hypothetical protein